MRYTELNANIIMNNKQACKGYKTQSHMSRKYDVQALSHRIRPKWESTCMFFAMVTFLDFKLVFVLLLGHWLTERGKIRKTG